MIDQVTVGLAAGAGGNGAVSFHREKFVTKGGPDGGRGGRGGHVIAIASGQINTLLRYRRQRSFRAVAGQPGGTSNRRGRDGEDLILEVPAGTIISRLRRDGSIAEQVADLADDGAGIVIARGGRGGNGNAWVHPTSSVNTNAMYIRDQWFRDAHFAMGYPEALQREVHVYFNGLYWGMHHLFERIEEEWSAERFGGEQEDWEGFRIVGGNNIEVINGTQAEVSARMLNTWRSTLDAALAGDLEGVQQYLDLDAFIDYLLLNFHAGNNDWDQNNVRAMRQINPPGKYMFFCHDAERAGFNALSSINININVNTVNTFTRGGCPRARPPTWCSACSSSARTRRG